MAVAEGVAGVAWAEAAVEERRGVDGEGGRAGTGLGSGVVVLLPSISLSRFCEPLDGCIRIERIACLEAGGCGAFSEEGWAQRHATTARVPSRISFLFF
jgi:hypothetical protein